MYPDLIGDYLAMFPDVYALYRNDEHGFAIVFQEKELYVQYTLLVDEGDLLNIIPFDTSSGFGNAPLRAIAQGIEIFLQNYS